MTVVRGIDTSNWQGAFDYDPWKDKIDYGWVMATEGTQFTDPDFRHDWETLRDLGKVAFAYHYMLPAESSPQRQAKYLLDFVDGNGGWRKGNHVILDAEVTQGLAPHEVSNWAAAFKRCINAAKKRCLIYTYPAFAAAGNCQTVGKDYLAVADYSGETPLPQHAPACPPWRSWRFWQYTDEPVDQSIWNGTLEELRKFAGLDA